MSETLEERLRHRAATNPNKMIQVYPGDVLEIIDSLKSISEVRALLQKNADAHGQAKLYAKHIGVSPQYLNDVLRGRREPGKKMLRALGLDKVVFYRAVRNQGVDSVAGALR